MKSLFSIFSLVLAATLLATFAAEFAGFSVSAVDDTDVLLFGFVATFTALLVHHDYTRSLRQLSHLRAAPAKAAHALAA